MLSWMPGWPLPLLDSSRGVCLSSSDVALLREIEQLMPAGSRAQELLVRDDGLPSQLVDAQQELLEDVHSPPPGASPTLRRASDAVLDELRRYFMAGGGVRVPANARAVLGGRLARFAAELLQQREELAADGVRWWCEFLLRVEDARPFTRSNWARASAFEEALSRCRLILLDLSGRLKDTSRNPALECLREQLREAHSSARNAGDHLLELLYIGLRPRPAVERCTFHELQRLAEAGESASAPAFEASEDKLIFHILNSEQVHAADDLAFAFLEGPEGCVALDVKDCTDQLQRLGESASNSAANVVKDLLQQLQAARPAVAQTIGSRATLAFLELHGLYCLLAALLQRLELCLQAVSEYARFVCFLPVYRATLLDLQDFLPKLRNQVSDNIEVLATAYESLPRAMAPPGRAAVLEKCRLVVRRFQHSESASGAALATLKMCTPQETLQDFDGWRQDDQRWAQFARLRLAANALLPASRVEALDVPGIAESLASGGVKLSHEVAFPRTQVRVAEASVDARREMNTNLFSAWPVDEDTRLHVAASGLALLGQQAWEEALQPGCKRTAEALGRQLQGLLDYDTEGKATRLVGCIVDRLRPMPAKVGAPCTTDRKSVV